MFRRGVVYEYTSYECLTIFYPRLVKGGYIMVHDYNNIVFSGAEKAVKKYCDERQISIVPIPDMAGSIIITK